MKDHIQVDFVYGHVSESIPNSCDVYMQHNCWPHFLFSNETLQLLFSLGL